MDHHKQFSIVRDGVQIQIGIKRRFFIFRFSRKRVDETLKKAQFELDKIVMTSMIPYMPKGETGNLRRFTQAMSDSFAGTGIVYAAVPPYGRYQYMGKVMVEADTGRGAFYIPTVGFRFHKDVKLVATNRDLTYSEPQATARWFDTAKNQHLQSWVTKVKQVVGENLNGR